MATTVATAWGAATVLDEVTLPQEADGKEFVSLVQLLAGRDGARYVRFAYTTDGKARRGPVTLREADVARLGEALADHPELAEVLASTRAGAGKGGGRRG